MRYLSIVSTSLILAALAACTPTSTQIGLRPESIPASGIYTPEMVVVRDYPREGYEFAAAGSKAYSSQQIAEVAKCRALLFARQRGLSGWYIKDQVETASPWMRQVNLIAIFYRGEKPPFVTNENLRDWCRGQS